MRTTVKIDYADRSWALRNWRAEIDEGLDVIVILAAWALAVGIAVGMNIP